jgi:hypothetical protein
MHCAENASDSFSPTSASQIHPEIAEEVPSAIGALVLDVVIRAFNTLMAKMSVICSERSLPLQRYLDVVVRERRVLATVTLMEDPLHPLTYRRFFV